MRLRPRQSITTAAGAVDATAAASHPPPPPPPQKRGIAGNSTAPVEFYGNFHKDSAVGRWLVDGRGSATREAVVSERERGGRERNRKKE